MPTITRGAEMASCSSRPSAEPTGSDPSHAPATPGPTRTHSGAFSGLNPKPAPARLSFSTTTTWPPSSTAMATHAANPRAGAGHRPCMRVATRCGSSAPSPRVAGWPRRCSRSSTAGASWADELSARDVREAIRMVTAEPDVDSRKSTRTCSRPSARGGSIAREEPLAAALHRADPRATTWWSAVGPAGTGKTYLAMAMAIAALNRHEVSRVMLTRPAVEAARSSGSCPETLGREGQPVPASALRRAPRHDGLRSAERLMERDVIEVAPLAFMRGRTLNDSFVILDEAQNTTPEQMKMFLTRLGYSSKAVVTGDVTQIDLRRGHHEWPGRSHGRPRRHRGDRFHALQRSRRGPTSVGAGDHPRLRAPRGQKKKSAMSVRLSGPGRRLPTARPHGRRADRRRPGDRTPLAQGAVAPARRSRAGHGSELSLSLVDDREMAEINLQYRGIEGPTDVLSFSLVEGEGAEHRGGLLGDVVIGIETAARQARERHRSLSKTRWRACWSTACCTCWATTTEAPKPSAKACRRKSAGSGERSGTDRWAPLPAQPRVSNTGRDSHERPRRRLWMAAYAFTTFLSFPAPAPRVGAGRRARSRAGDGFAGAGLAILGLRGLSARRGCRQLRSSGPCWRTA